MDGADIRLAESGRSVSEAVVEAVADRKGVDITGLETPLYRVIDPDALERLVAMRRESGTRSPVCVRFRYYGYDVIVDSDGSVSLS